MDISKVIQQLFEGFGMSLAIFGATLALSLPIGLIFSFMQRSKIKPLKGFMDTFIWIIRGTPLMLQIIAIYYGPGLMGWKLTIRDEFLAVIIAFTLNYSCYMSVIFKGGLNAVPKGQYEACQVLGLSKKQTFKMVILPQVYKNILPPMSNEIITLVKDTSLASVIGLAELIFVGREILNKGFLLPFFSTGLFYLAFVGILTLLFAYLEKRTKRYS